jgi:hypothetical protein
MSATDEKRAFIDSMIAHLVEAKDSLETDANPTGHQGAVSAALWTVFDNIWMERMGRKHPISPELFRIVGLVPSVLPHNPGQN